MRRDLPVGTVTFLFSDIESSTRMLQTLGDRFVTALETHQQIVRDAVGAHGGIEVGTEGDSFFCVFASAPDALIAAAEAQRAIEAHEWPEAHRLRVRMGVHTGDGRLGGDDYVGLDVHRAARIAAAAHGGQIIASEATHGLAARAVDLAFRDLGEHRLKDLAAPERLYQVVASGLPEDFPPPASLTAAAQNLPVTLTSFVGRDAELADIAALVGGERVVTLTGPGGVGKTRLAIESARRLVPAFPDGVAYVGLAAADSAEGVAPEVAAALGLAEQAGRPAEDTVTDHLARQTVLLILDNCEHLREPVAELVARWMQSTPGVTVLATSRAPLGIDGERTYPVEPLPLPPEDGDLAELEVVRLFADRAAAVDPRFDPTAHLAVIAAIGRQLDGMPLAIELAAARTGALDPADILARLDDRFALLKGGAQAGLSPHRTLEAAVEWSHELLSEPEAMLFSRLSVFAGGFTLDAAEAVCSDDRLDRNAILDLLEGLIGNSLVASTPGARGRRYAMFESIRQFAERLLRDAGEWDRLTATHGEYFTAWAGEKAALLRSREQLDALQDLEADHGNLRAALNRSWDRGDRPATLVLAGALPWFWYLHGHFSEGERWAGRFLEDDSLPPSRELVRLMIGAAEFDYRTGQLDRSEERLTRATEAARAIPSRSLEMWAYSHQATVDLFRGSSEPAARHAQESLDIAEELGAVGAAAYAVYLQAAAEAWDALAAGTLSPEAAAEVLERLEPIVAASNQLGDRNMIGHSLQFTGLLAAIAGDGQRAAADLDAATTAFGQLESAGCAAHCLESVAYVAAGTSPEMSAAILSAADSIRSSVGASPPALEQRIRALAVERIQKAAGDHGLGDTPEQGVSVAEAVALGRAALASGEAGDGA